MGLPHGTAIEAYPTDSSKKGKFAMKLHHLTVAAAAAFLMGGVSAQAAIITFDAQGLTGPSFASSVSASTTTTPLVVNAGGDTVTFTNGAILNDTSNLPADETSVYYNSYFLPGSTGATTKITFSAPISNFFLNLYNGQTHSDTYTISDNMGRSTTVSIAPNLSSGVSLISFPAVGNVITITTSDTSGYDFAIDNIGFNQATPAVPEPTTWAMMLAGFGLVGYAMRKRSRVHATVAYS